MSPTAKFIASYVGYAAALQIVPGPWTKWDKGQVVDLWTLTHVGWSMIAKRMGVPLKTLMALSVANEVGEAMIRKFRPNWTWGSPEGPANIAADLVANYVGYKL